MTEVTVYEKEIDPIRSEADKLQIEDTQSLEDAAMILSNLNKTLDRITTEREKVTKPLNEALKAERSRWKPLETKLEQAIVLVRSKISTYQTAHTLKARKEEDKIIERVNKGTLKADTAITKLQAIDAPETVVNTDVGTLKFRTVRKFRIKNLSLVPREYLIPNEVLIRSEMAKNKDIPGVEYFEEQMPVNYR